MSLFPILSWITRYSLSSNAVLRHFFIIFFADIGWLTGDVIAGLTVGMVVVPQGMSYAQVYLIQIRTSRSKDLAHRKYKIATLAPEYGLYSSFVGVLIYCVSSQPFLPSCVPSDVLRCSHSSLRPRKMSLLGQWPLCHSPFPKSSNTYSSTIRINTPVQLSLQHWLSSADSSFWELAFSE